MNRTIRLNDKILNWISGVILLTGEDGNSIIWKIGNIEREGNMQISTNEEIIKILPKGLITIPKKLRESLGLTDNKLARVKKEKGRLIIEPVSTLSYPVRSYSDREIDEFFKLDEEETQELRKKKLLP